MKILIYFTAVLFLWFNTISFSQNKQKEVCVCKNPSINESFMPFRQRVSKYLKKPNLSKFVKDITPLNKAQFEDLRIIDADISVFKGERLLKGKVITKNYLDFKLNKIGGLTLRLNPCLQKGKHTVHWAEILLENNAFNINFRDQYLSFLFSKELFTPLCSKKKQSELIFKSSEFKYRSTNGLWLFLPKDVQFTESKIGKTKLSIDFKSFKIQDLHERMYNLDKGGLVITRLTSKIKHWFKTYEIPLKRNLIGADYFYGELSYPKSKYKKGILRKLKKRMTYVYETKEVLKFYYTTEANPSSEIPEDINRLFTENYKWKRRNSSQKQSPKANSNIILSDHFDNDNDFFDEDEEIEIVEDSSTKKNIIKEVFSFAVAEQKPIFPGCENVSIPEQGNCFQLKLRDHISKNLKYPKKARDLGIQEKVYVSFIVNKKGMVVDSKVIRGQNKLLKDEALRLINSLPKMKPAILRGQNVNVQYTVPIRFKVQ
ncbi:MAG: energy transducer TonB [Flavobacteriales bacterium]